MEQQIKNISVKQNRASNPNYSIWTSASAGSGKTTVLVKRLLRMLLNDIPISKILCITFTNTGATEMKNRINNKLAEWTTLSDSQLETEIVKLTGDIANLKNNILKARTLFTKILDNGNDFKILTIHSFCQQIIKRFPLEANIIPNFQIADELLADELLEKAKEQLLKTKDEEIKQAIQLIFAYKNEEDFLKLLKDVIKQKDNLLYLRNKFYSVNGVIEELSKILQIEKNCEIEDLENDFLSNINFKMLTNEIEELIESVGTNFDKNYLKLSRDFNLNNTLFIDEYLNIFLTEEGKITERLLSSKISKIHSEFQAFIKEEAERVYNFKEKRNNLINFKFTSAFLKITYHIFEIYDRLKRDKGYLDYSDLIFETNKLLNDVKYRNLNGENFYSSWINYKLDEGIDHLLIDEAQDTSPIQWEIVKSITEEFFSGYGRQENDDRTIFVVGDEKQSIFSFQGAEPSNFNIMLNYYKERIISCGKKFENIYLDTSFRSLQVILNVTDNVFSDNLRKKAISKTNEEIVHKIARVEEGLGRVEIWPLISVEKDEDTKPEEEKNKRTMEAAEWKINYLDDIEISNKQKLAEIIANKIADWFKNEKIIYSRKDKKERLLKYSDIMILVKKRDKNFINALIKQFNRKNIPTMGNDKFNLKDNIISQDIIALCKFILFNEDDLNLANIFKSPFLNMSENDLYKLCIYKNNNNCSLWQALKDDEKYNEKRLFLESVIEYSKKSTTYELLFYIFDSLNMRKNFKKRFLYLTDDILNEFLKIANNYIKSHNDSTLLSFINFIETTDLEIKRDMDQNSNEIRIITIHSAKGLESPIVFLPDTNHSSRTINQIDDILNYKIEGLDYTIPLIQKEKSDFLENIKRYMKSEVENEYLRLLYVAMTRAENELYICDCKNKQEVRENSWYAILQKTISSDSNKKTKNNDKYIDGEILFIGDDEKYADNNTILKEANNQNTNEIDSIIEILSLKSKKINNIKVINPSRYYSENMTKNITENSTNIEKGKLVHKLLEILPNINKEEWNNIIEFYLADKNHKEEVKNIVLNILNSREFSFLFGNNSRAEVSIFGKIDNEIISGKVDRLLILDNKVCVVDYKNTNVLPKNIPEKYKKQLELYKKLLQKIYKDKIIETFILWTSFGIIEKLDS